MPDNSQIIGFCRLEVRHVVRFLLLITLLLVASSAVAASSWELVENGASFSFSHDGQQYDVQSPASGRELWLDIREEYEWGRSSAAYNGRPMTKTAPALIDMRQRGVLAWEVALIAGHEQAGNISPESAARWIDILREDDYTEAELIQQVFRLRQYDRGSALAVLPPHCVPTKPAILEAAESVATVETSIPARRTLDTTDGVVLPYQAFQVLEQSGETDFVRAVSYALNGATLRGNSWVVGADDGEVPQRSMNTDPDVNADDHTIESPIGPGPAAESEASQCDPDKVALAAELGLLTRHRWSDLEDDIRALFEDGYVPSKLYWRAAVYQYLQTHREGVALVREMYAQKFPDSERGNLFMRALVDLADGTVHEPAQSWPTARDATNPTWLWIYAEHLRLRLQLEEAAEVAARLIDQDSDFLGAWLTQAAIALRRGNTAKARANLHHLEQAAPEESIYQYWVNELAAQLAAGGG
jgi:hypothetical protein